MTARSWRALYEAEGLPAERDADAVAEEAAS